MGATSTTDLEPLSDHGAPPRVRRIAAAHVAPPRASRHFSARHTLLNVAFLNPTSQMENGAMCHIIYSLLLRKLSDTRAATKLT